MQILSGGQTGADRGGHEAALALGLAHGGWCPRGRRAEDGTIPERYGAFQETEETDYAVRTERNVREADATLLFTRGRLTGGSLETKRVAARLGRPLLVVDLGAEPDPVARIDAWLREQRVRVLNVAGPRESRAPGMQAAVRDVLVRALAPAARPGRRGKR